MPVSDAVRESVRQDARGWCELFHDVPVPGTMIVHTDHQGMGGAPADAECNDPNKLIWGCFECHERVDGRAKHAPEKIVRFDRAAGELEIVDIEMRKVDHSRIFFHNQAQWIEALDQYPVLADAVRRRNEAEYDLAKGLAYFKPRKGQPELFRVCPEGREADFRKFVSLLGMTWSGAKELIPVGEWAHEQALDELMRGIDLDALDALRRVPEAEMIRLMGLARGKPAEFWAEVDKARKRKRGKRSHYLQLTPDGRLQDIGLHDADPQTEEAFALVKGVVVRPNDRVIG